MKEVLKDIKRQSLQELIFASDSLNEGDAEERLRAPSIHAVYLGKNMSEQNKGQVIHFCEKRGIPFE